MNTDTSTPVGGSAAADFFSALNRLIAEARAGGIRHKVRAGMAMGEGFGQQAAAEEQYARELQENGQYPAAAWEPFIKAAGMLRAAGAACAEGTQVIATIGRTPVEEVGQNAPHRDEIVKSAQ